MVFSNAQPVQFWPIECDTYNEHLSDGVYKKCFCMPWGCDDPIKIQFSDIPETSPENPNDFSLSVRDDNGDEITSLPFTVSNRFSLDPLSEAENYGVGGDWTISANPSRSSVSNSKILRIAINRAKAAVDYVFHYKLTKDSTFLKLGNVYLGIYDSSMNLIDEIVLNYNGNDVDVLEGDVTFNGGAIVPGYIGIYEDPQVGTSLLTVDELYTNYIDTSPYYYNLSFIPSENDLCNVDVMFVVHNETIDADVEKSDCQRISSYTKNTLLIKYYHHMNVFGLSYENGQPDFNIRVPAIFFHQKFPETDEVLELSAELLTVNGSMRKQRLLDTDYLPYYIHEKIKLVLKHQFITIFNKQWVKQEAYEIQDGNNRYPHKKAKCFLSEKEYLQRNVL